MLKCEICYDWCSRLKTTRQWWDIAKKDWNTLNGKDLPYFIAILTVLRETTIEIFQDDCYSQNHSNLEKNKEGYSLVSNKNCEFIPLTDQQHSQWRGLYKTIRVFRNGSAHISNVNKMRPSFTQIKDHEDPTQDFYRYAPFPDVHRARGSDLSIIHEFIRSTILSEIRSEILNLASPRVKYEFCHVERGPFIDLLHTKMIELLEEIKVW